MHCALIACGMSLSLSLSLPLALGSQAAAAEAPSDSAPQPAEVKLPGIYFTPAAVSINESFKSERSSGSSHPDIIMFNGVAELNSMKLKILATTDVHWQILKVENPVLIDALTATGEALLSPNSDDNHFDYFIDSGFIHLGTPPPSFVTLALTIPQHPTTSLRSLVATMDFILSREDAIKSAKIKITPDESDPPMLDGCDVTFTRIDDKVKVKYTMGAFAFIKSMTFLDAAGEACTGHTVTQSMESSKLSMSVQFPGKGPTTVALEYFGDLHRVHATMRLKGFPLVGVGSPRDLETHAAEFVHAVVKPVAPDPPSQAPRAAPAPNAPGAPGIPAAPVP